MKSRAPGERGGREGKVGEKEKVKVKEKQHKGGGGGGRGEGGEEHKEKIGEEGNGGRRPHPADEGVPGLHPPEAVQPEAVVAVVQPVSLLPRLDVLGREVLEGVGHEIKLCFV